MIAEGYQYQRDTLYLPLNLSGLPASVDIEGNKLLLKNEFHVSLVCVGEIMGKEDVIVPNFPERVIKDFNEHIKENPVAFKRFTNDFRVAEEGEKKTLIAMCEVTNLEKFFGLLNGKYDLRLGYPPLHVTLYSLQPDRGIFVTDKDDLEILTKAVVSPLGDIDLNTCYT